MKVSEIRRILARILARVNHFTSKMNSRIKGVGKK